jgi:hypothetical protein
MSRLDKWRSKLVPAGTVLARSSRSGAQS